MTTASIMPEQDVNAPAGLHLACQMDGRAPHKRRVVTGSRSKAAHRSGFAGNAQAAKNRAKAGNWFSAGCRHSW
jgi:hypothetical protein